VARDRTRHTRHENLVAYVDDAPIATVPDLICVVGAADAEPITTELPRYGQRVAVVGIPCHPLLRTPEAVAMVGPRAFGYELAYIPSSRAARCPGRASRSRA
jgi:DUF917 family protein